MFRFVALFLFYYFKRRHSLPSRLDLLHVSVTHARCFFESRLSSPMLHFFLKAFVLGPHTGYVNTCSSALLVKSITCIHTVHFNNALNQSASKQHMTSQGTHGTLNNTVLSTTTRVTVCYSSFSKVRLPSQKTEADKGLVLRVTVLLISTGQQ